MTNLQPLVQFLQMYTLSNDERSFDLPVSLLSRSIGLKGDMLTNSRAHVGDIRSWASKVNNGARRDSCWDELKLSFGSFIDIKITTDQLIIISFHILFYGSQVGKPDIDAQ